MNRSEIDSKSLKSSVSKETTKIPKPKSSTKDPRPSLSKVQKLPPEEKKFSIRRTSKTILETKAPKTGKIYHSESIGNLLFSRCS